MEFSGNIQLHSRQELKENQKKFNRNHHIEAVDIRYPEERLSPQDGRHVDSVGYGLRASLKPGDLDKLEQPRASAEPVSYFVAEKRVERSPSMDKPSTSTVDSSKSAVLSDLRDHIKGIRNSQTGTALGTELKSLNTQLVRQGGEGEADSGSGDSWQQE